MCTPLLKKLENKHLQEMFCMNILQKHNILPYELRDLAKKDYFCLLL